MTEYPVPRASSAGMSRHGCCARARELSSPCQPYGRSTGKIQRERHSQLFHAAHRRTGSSRHPPAGSRWWARDPGDEGLLTLRGAQLIGQASLVVAAREPGARIRQLLHPDAELIVTADAGNGEPT